jgi:hypothetical protein
MHPPYRKLTSFVLGCSLGFMVLQGFSLAQLNPQSIKNSIASNLLRPEYYAAIDFIADGQTTQALALLDSALAQARMVNDQRGIDSVPPLVMMGESHLEQCDIALALEKYDAALQISLMGQRWLSLLKSPPGSIRADTRTREITWAPNSRGTQMGTFTEAWPIALSAPDVLLENTPQGNPGKIVSIDALEILRCQAIALRRRFQLLGPLAKHSPLTRPVLEMFRVNTQGQPEPIVCAVSICRALAEMGAGERVESARILKQNLSLASGVDHPLTAVALLALADLAIDANEILEAEERATEAALAAARASQMEHLAEAIEYLSEAGFADGHDATVVKMLAQIVSWSANKSRLVTIRGQVEWTRLLALMGDLEGFKKNANVTTTMLLPKPIVLPRAEAVLRYARAKTEFLEGSVGDGLDSLVESVAFLRSPSMGYGAPREFQLNLAASLVSSKSLNEDVAEELLAQLIAPSNPGSWRVHPLEQLSWLFADKQNAIEQLNDLRLRRRSDVEMVGAFDEATCRRYRQQGELESRVFDLKMAIFADRKLLTATESAQMALIRSQIPACDPFVAKINDLIGPLLTSPKWDMRKWSEEDSRRWEGATRLSDSQESILWAAAVGPLVVPEVFPPRHSQELLSQSLSKDDAVIYFAFHGEQLRGYLYQSGKWKSWVVADAGALSRQTQQILNDLMLLKMRDGTVNEVQKIWISKKRIDLRNQLFPREVWSSLRTASRWIVVPDRFLWYLPLETLPVSDQPFGLPSIAEHRIVYSPTLGLVPQLIDSNAGMAKFCVDVHANDFLSKSEIRAKELREEIAAIRSHVIVDLSGKGGMYPPSQFFKIAADKLTSFSGSALDSIAPIPTDRQPNLSTIHTWRRLPWGTPSSVVLPGVNSLPMAEQVTGDEWLRVLLPAIAQGTRHLIVSRWPVGGESSASLFRSFVDNRQDMSASEAWQRSVVSSWEEQFDQRGEPLFQKAPFAGDANVVSGKHPLLWSGYITIGDPK